MLFSTIGQIYVFLWMTGAGLLVGMLLSLSEGIRRLLAAGFWLSLTIDICFGLCSGAVLIVALVAGSYGVVRLYEFLGVCLGLLLYLTGVRPLLGAIGRLKRPLRHIFVKIQGYRLIKVIFK